MYNHHSLKKRNFNNQAKKISIVIIGYNTESNLLKINNSVLNRTIYNLEGEEKYTIEINEPNPTSYNYEIPDEAKLAQFEVETSLMDEED